MATIYQLTLKTIANNGLFTTSYILGLLSILWFTNTITILGTLSSTYIIAILLIIDLIKSKYFAVNTASKIDIHGTLIFILSTVTFYFVIAILYGAPVLTDHEKTLMFSLLLTTCTICHSLIHVGVKGSVNIFMDLASFNAELTHHDLVLRNVQCSLIGAWGFAGFIPLDWDVPWQKWPVPCNVGTLVGYMVGHLVSVCLVVYAMCFKVKRKKSFV